MMKDEITRMMLAPAPAAAVNHAASTGQLADLLPEVDALRRMNHEGRHKDVYRHSLQVLRHAVEFEPDGPDLILRLAALMHDIGKPATRSFKGTKVSFVSHEHVGANLARKRLRAVGFDQETVKAVGRLVGLHMRLHGFQESSWSDSAVRRLLTDAGSEIDRLLIVMRSDVTSKRDHRQAAMRRMYDTFEERVQQVRARDAEASVRPELSGEEIMRILAIPPGPEVGQARQFLLQLRKDEGLLGHDEATRRLHEWALSHDAART